MDILVIPDSHVRPGVRQNRWASLGRLISDRKPDVIVQLGDHFDMPSLCSYDKGKGVFAERRLKTDVEVGHETLADLDRWAKHDCPRYLLGGNHDEGRVQRFLEFEPQFTGIVSVDMFKHEGWKWVPFLKPLVLAGISFAHYVPKGVLGKPAGGEHPAYTILKSEMSSTVVGHTHVLDYDERTNGKDRKVQCLVAGCFLEPGQREAYAGRAQKFWHNGVSYLWACKDGQFDLEFISTERLMKE